MPYYIAIDIGATWTRIGLADESLRFISREKIKTKKKGTPIEFLENICVTIDSMLRQNDISSIKAIGIGSIGPLDLRAGKILDTPNIEIKNIPIKEYMQKKYNTKCSIVNDCTAAVIAEKFFSKKGIDNIVYVTLSSGIGGGAIIDGNVLFGKDGNAVEIGHFVIDPTGQIRCGCGGYGHWEAYVSGANIHKFCKLLIEQKFSYKEFKHSQISRLTTINNITYEVLSMCAKNNDELALKIFDEIGKINTIGFANIVNAFDPDIIVVGGSIALKNPANLILKPIKENIEQFTINKIPKIEKTRLGDDAVLLGALKIATTPEIIPEKFRE